MGGKIMGFSKLEKEQEVNQLMDLFQKNSEKMLQVLKEGMEITIVKNKEGFAMYRKLIKKIK